MAKRLLTATTITLTAFADSTNLTDATYPFILQGGSTTQRIDILEVYMGGQSTSSAVAEMILSRDSTVGGTVSDGTGVMDAAADASTAALAAPPVSGNTCTTKPQRSSSLHLFNWSFNAFGGIIRYQVAPNQQANILGNTSSLGEVSLSCFTGGSGITSAELQYEPYASQASVNTPDFERRTFRKNGADPLIAAYAAFF